MQYRVKRVKSKIISPWTEIIPRAPLPIQCYHAFQVLQYILFKKKYVDMEYFRTKLWLKPNLKPHVKAFRKIFEFLSLFSLLALK